MIEEIEETNRLLRQELRMRIPLETLIASGRTDEIIERGAQREAKDAIMAEKDYAKRQRLIIQHMALFSKEGR